MMAMKNKRFKNNLLNVIAGGLMGIFSYFIDIHTVSVLFSIVVAFVVNYYIERKYDFSKFEKNGFWNFFIAMFVVWTILYNIRFYMVIPTFR